MNVGDWQARAACLGYNDDSDDFFFDPSGLVLGAPTKDTRLRRWRAKQICAQCPVAQLCAEHAEQNTITFGVYGGLDQHERAILRRKDTDRGVPRVFAAHVGHRMVSDGYSVAEAAARMNLPEAYVQSSMDKHADTPAVLTAVREYEGWASAWAGASPAAVAARHSIPHAAASEMCEAVDRVSAYRGPRGRERYVRRNKPIAC